MTNEQEPNYDAMADKELLARCAAARAATRESQLVRGVAMLGGDKWPDETKRDAFMAIFHPEHTNA